MTRNFDAAALITLPRVDANQAAVLAQQLEAATIGETGNQRILPEAVQAALDDVKGDRAALQAVLGTAPESEEVRIADKLEDNAAAALILILIGWSRLKGQFPLGDIAANAGAYLGTDDGIAFVNIRARDEFGVVDTKLKTIERENLAGSLGDLGLSPLLGHLREVHERYGNALGILRAQPAEERAVVRSRYDALLDSMRHYVGAVTGSVQRKKPETKALADMLLLPVTTWQSDPVQKSQKDAGGTNEDAGTGGTG